MMPGLVDPLAPLDHLAIVQVLVPGLLVGTLAMVPGIHLVHVQVMVHGMLDWHHLALANVVVFGMLKWLVGHLAFAHMVVPLLGWLVGLGLGSESDILLAALVAAPLMCKVHGQVVAGLVVPGHVHCLVGDVVADTVGLVDHLGPLALLDHLAIVQVLVPGLLVGTLAMVPGVHLAHVQAMVHGMLDWHHLALANVVVFGMLKWLVGNLAFAHMVVPLLGWLVGLGLGSESEILLAAVVAAPLMCKVHGQVVAGLVVPGHVHCLVGDVVADTLGLVVVLVVDHLSLALG